MRPAGKESELGRISRAVSLGALTVTSTATERPPKEAVTTVLPWWLPVTRPREVPLVVTEAMVGSALDQSVVRVTSLEVPSL